ncbi:MAG TPA: hypothetical protein VFI20_11355, partial [Terracidiphilus sp.]|nr:hypothetical protein [Terracidiphilus sp.]
VECSLHHKPWVTDGPESNLYGLEPNFGCCTANFHQGWPKFTNSLIMLSSSKQAGEQDGLVAAAYAPCEARVLLGGTVVHIMEETDYPFRGSVHFILNPASSCMFPLRLRIPAWAEGTVIRVNGSQQAAPTAGTFALVQRTWSAGDRVEVDFSMRPRISRWFNNSVAVERGPLVFSYGIGENWVKLRDRGMTADWQVFPSAQWNYAVKVSETDPAGSIAVSEAAVGELPFGRRHAPVCLSLKARRIDEWRAVDGAADPLPQSPVACAAPEETISLIPYAAAKLRITAFPLSKT